MVLSLTVSVKYSQRRLRRLKPNLGFRECTNASNMWASYLTLRSGGLLQKINFWAQQPLKILQIWLQKGMSCKKWQHRLHHKIQCPPSLAGCMLERLGNVISNLKISCCARHTSYSMKKSHMVSTMEILAVLSHASCKVFIVLH